MKRLWCIIFLILLWAAPAHPDTYINGQVQGSGGLPACSNADYTTGTSTSCAGTPANAKVELDKKQATLTATPKSISIVNDAGAITVLTCDGANQMIGRNAANNAWECKTSLNAAIRFDEVLIDCNGSADPYAHCTGANASTLTSSQTGRTVINSYGRGEAQTVTLDAAAKGATVLVVVGTQHNSALKIQRAGSDTITWSSGGTDTTGKTYFQETNQPVGSRVSCITYQTGASAWSWLCGSITGTWVTD